MKGHLFFKFLVVVTGVVLVSGCAGLRERISALAPDTQPDAEEAAEATEEADAKLSSIRMQEGAPAPSRQSGMRAYKLKPGDQIIIALRGIPQSEKIEDVIDEGGYITLTYIDRIRAAGKTTSELEQDIRQAYIDGKIYKNISVNVIVPGKSYYVRGEVKQPGRFPLPTGTTLVQAIAGAGGFTEYANPKKVFVIRGDTKMTVDVRDLEQNPHRDLELEAGDVIVVDRSFL